MTILTPRALLLHSPVAKFVDYHVMNVNVMSFCLLCLPSLPMTNMRGRMLALTSCSQRQGADTAASGDAFGSTIAPASGGGSAARPPPQAAPRSAPGRSAGDAGATPGGDAFYTPAASGGAGRADRGSGPGGGLPGYGGAPGFGAGSSSSGGETAHALGRLLASLRAAAEKGASRCGPGQRPNIGKLKELAGLVRSWYALACVSKEAQGLKRAARQHSICWHGPPWTELRGPEHSAVPSADQPRSCAQQPSRG